MTTDRDAAATHVAKLRQRERTAGEFVDTLGDAEAATVEVLSLLRNCLMQHSGADAGELEPTLAADALTYLTSAGQDLRAAIRILRGWHADRKTLADDAIIALTASRRLGVRTLDTFKRYASALAGTAQPTDILDAGSDRFDLTRLEAVGLIHLHTSGRNDMGYLQLTSEGRRLAAEYGITTPTQTGA